MLKIPVLIYFIIAFSLQVSGQTDTLKYMPLPRIMDLIYQQKDSADAIAISNYLTERARLVKDSTAVSWGHYGNYLYRSYPDNLPYLDSLIYSTKGLNNTEEIFGLITKADYFFYDRNEFATALTFYLLARELSVETKHKRYIQTTTNSVASIKFLAGEFSEALELYHQYEPLNPNDSLSYFNIANCHYKLNNTDSLSYYSLIGIKKSIKDKDASNYESFLRLNGISHYLQGNLKRALDSLHKSRALTSDTIDLGSSYYYSALAHEAMGNADSTVYYYKKISSLNQEPEIYFAEIKNVYLSLYDNAKKNVQSEEQLKYIEKYLGADSILASKSKGLISKVVKDYDLPLFEERRNQLRAALASKNNLSYVVIALCIALLLSIVFFSNRFIRQKKRLKEAIGNPENYLKKVHNHRPVMDSKRNSLSSELIVELNRFFHKFEIEKGFLDTTTSLQQLSTLADTNTSYLSNFLNSHKGGYSNYINSLRAQFAFNDMPKNPKILIFTLDHIAKLYGFTSLRAFNRSFEKFIKIKPRDYLAQIKKRQQSEY